MSYDDQIKLLLERIKNDSLTNEPLKGMNDEQFGSFIEQCEANDYISFSPTPAVVISKTNVNILTENIYLTKKGHDFLDGKKEQPIQQFNIDTVTNSYLGNNGSVTNNFGMSFEYLMSFIEHGIEPQDKDEAKEIIETVQKTELTPGLLKRFDSFLGKYPNFTSSIGMVIVDILTHS